MNEAIKTVIKGAISIALMAFLLYKVPISELKQAFSLLNVPLFAGAAGLFFLHQFLTAYCWQITLSAQNNAISIWRVVKVHFVGNFFGVFMPTSIGMDIVRTYSLSRQIKNGVDAASSMFVSRVVGYLVFFGIALVVAVPVVQKTGNVLFLWVVLAASTSFVVGCWVLVQPRFLKLVNLVFQRIRLGKIGDKLLHVQQGIIAFRNKKAALTKLIIWSALYQLLGIYIHYLVGISLGINVEFKYYFIFVPVIMAVTILPLSLGGIGTRELAFVALFSPLGVLKAQSLTLSLLLFALGVAVALFGGILYWTSERGEKKQPEKIALKN